MNHQEVVEQVVEIVTPIAEGRVATIDEGTALTSELGLDSLKVMDLVVAVEDRFDISIPINALADVRVLGDLVSLVQNALGG